jgi:hypothetical protein
MLLKVKEIAVGRSVKKGDSQRLAQEQSLEGYSIEALGCDYEICHFIRSEAGARIRTLARRVLQKVWVGFRPN